MSGIHSLHSAEGLQLLFNMLCWSVHFVSVLLKVLDIDGSQHFLKEHNEMYLLENESNFHQS